MVSKRVDWEDIYGSQPHTAAVTTSEAELVPSRLGKTRRTQLIIQNTSPTVVTITKGDDPAVANVGIRLTQNQTFIESDDAGFLCWQGAVHVVGSGASTVVWNETVLPE